MDHWKGLCVAGRDLVTSKRPDEVSQAQSARSVESGLGHLRVIYDPEELAEIHRIRSAPAGPINSLIWFAYRHRLGILRRLLAWVLHVELPHTAATARIHMPHPYGIIINGGCVLGLHVVCYQNVTIGYKPFGKNRGIPTIGDHAILFPGAIVLGGVKVGARAVVGAGAVVSFDVPDDHVVAGNPARLIGRIERSPASFHQGAQSNE